MDIDIELLDFQTYLDIEERIQSISDSLFEVGKLGAAQDELDGLFDIREKYENNFLLFFKTLMKAPQVILDIRDELIKLESSNEGSVDKDNPDTCITYGIEIEPSTKGKCWRYSVGDIVTVEETISTFHPFDEGDRIEILTLEGGEHAYQYYGKYTNGEIGVFLINDEEIE